MSRVPSRLLLAVMAALVATGSITFRPGPTAAAGTGSVSLTTIGAQYSQNFDSLATTEITNTTLPTGWFLFETGTIGATRNNDAYAFSSGTDTSGDTYSFGAAGVAERAFGTLLSGSVQPTIGASFTNNTGSTIAGLDIGFIGEMWRAGVLNRNAPDRLDFAISTDATSLTTGTWTNHDALDYLSTAINTTVGAKNGNDSAFRAAVFSSITGLLIPNGATFWIRWTDADFSPGADDGLGIDDFALIPQIDTSVNLSINDVSASEGNVGTTAFNFTVSLTNPAGAGGVTFDIGTANGSATTVDNDYVANSLAGQTIPAGLSTYAFNVLVNGDVTPELAESFFVNVTNVSGASVNDAQGLGTIGNDDGSCGLTYTAIPTIQGSGTGVPAPFAVTTEGTVVSDLEGTSAASFQGFYIQDAVGDGDPATSDGIFVFTGNGANTVNLGERVRVSGTARETFGLTSIHGGNTNTAPVLPAQIEHCGTGATPSTVDVEMPFASTTFLERHEGMLVRFPQALVIAEYFNYERFGEIVLALPWLEGETRPFTGTAIDEPGAPANARTLANSLRRVTLDDGLNLQNPAAVRHPNGANFALDNKFRGGDTVANAAGVLAFAFSLYRIQPNAPANYEPVNIRPEEPEDTGGRLTVAAMNTLNYFLTPDIDGGVTVPGVTDNSCGGLANLECRGHDSSQPLELERQRTKLVQALLGLDADVLGLNEIENTPNVDPAQDIADGLNAELEDEADHYARIDTGVIGTDAIRVGLLYRPDVVTPIGSFETLDHFDDPRFDENRSRPALAQTFEENATGERFTVIVNHLKSKGDSGLLASCPTTPVPDCDQLDGQAFWNFTRTRAAQALVDWAASDPTGSGDPDFMIIGDLNAYAREDPIDTIKAGSDDAAGTDDDWTSLIETYIGPFAYSFVFDGQSGYLDHALSNATLTGQVTGAAEWHINADEPDFLDYDTSFKPPAQDAIFEPNEFRTSDHDPVLVGLELDTPPTIVVIGGGTCSGTGGTVLVEVNDLVTAPGDLVFAFTGSSNTTLVPNGNVSLVNGGATRSIIVNPAAGQSGTAVLSFTLSDANFTVPFTLTVKVGTNGNDSLAGTAGADLLVGLQGNDTLSGLGDGDLLCGGNGIDVLVGGDGHDTLDGERATDIVSGGAGDDVLRGGLGIDALTGGTGADAFSGGSGADLYVDFTPSDGDTSDGT